jgi:hypothetical protein
MPAFRVWYEKRPIEFAVVRNNIWGCRVDLKYG